MKANVGLFTIALIVAILFGGCAPKLLIKDGPMVKGEKPIDIMVRPHQSLGIQITPALLSGDVTVVEGPLPDKILGEEYPGRIRWNGWAVTPERKEFFVQFVRIGMYRTGEFMFAIMIDGKKTELGEGTKVVQLSSVGNFVSDLSGNVYRINRNEFAASKQSRTDTVLAIGSEIGKRKEITGFVKTVKAWNRYKIKEGEIYCPYGETDLKRIARINPSYGLLERIIAKGHITLSSSPIYTVASIALSVIEGMRAPTEGWDYMSQLPNREMMAAIVEYIGQFRLELIKQLNDQIAANASPPAVSPSPALEQPIQEGKPNVPDKSTAVAKEDLPVIKPVSQPVVRAAVKSRPIPKKVITKVVKEKVNKQPNKKKQEKTTVRRRHEEEDVDSDYGDGATYSSSYHATYTYSGGRWQRQ